MNDKSFWEIVWELFVLVCNTLLWNTLFWNTLSAWHSFFWNSHLSLSWSLLWVAASPPALFTLFREVWVVWPPAPCRCTMFTKCCELPPTLWAGSRRFRATPYLELTIKQTDRSEKPVKAYVQEGPKLFQTWSDAVVVVTVIRRRSCQRSSIVISEVVIRSSYNRGIYK